MANSPTYDVLIIGGSYSGLSAALALGRSLRRVLIIDSGRPCNRQTPHSHNFLTQDGKPPAEISATARQQLAHYPTVEFHEGLAVGAAKTTNGFAIETEDGQTFHSRKLLFATGIRDLLPDIPGLADCWGKTVIHCPYCHGYEVRGERTGILGNGDYGFEFPQMIRHWTNDLTLFTNGPSTLSEEQSASLRERGIGIVEKEIEQVVHENGELKHLLFRDGSQNELSALYAHAPFEQHCLLPEQLGCALTEQGYLEVGPLQETTVDGIYASGDNSTPYRFLGHAVAMGTVAGVALNREMIGEEF